MVGIFDGLTFAYNGIRDVISFVNSAKNAELTADLKLKLSDVLDNIVSSKQAMIDLQEENNQLRARIKELEDNSELEKDFEKHEDGPYLTRKSEDHKFRYCQKCWAENKQEIQLIYVKDNGCDRISCPKCRYTIYL